MNKKTVILSFSKIVISLFIAIIIFYFFSFNTTLQVFIEKNAV